MAETVFFYLLSLIMLGAALSVALNRHPIYSVLSLLVVMGCLACLFVMLGAFFVAALQVLLYAGAVLVLFLFVVMLLNLEPEALARVQVFTIRAAGTLAALVLLSYLLRLIRPLDGQPTLASLPAPGGDVESLGRLLFTTYVLPFELTSFLILAAIVGAVTLGKPSPDEQDQRCQTPFPLRDDRAKGV